MSRERQQPPARAVALHYDGEGAPRITAKGAGEIAEAIMARAREHGVPLQENAELCALLARLELGEEIPRELYVAVAEVLAFAYWLTGRVPAPRENGNGNETRP